MKRIKTFLLLAALPFFGVAQTRDQALQSLKERKGLYISIGVYQADQTTNWQYGQTPPAVGVPFYNAAEGFSHDVSRTLLTLGIEKKSLFGTPLLRDGIFVGHYDHHGNYIDTDFAPTYNFIDADFGADLMVSPFNKTTANWLSDNNNQISSGGLTLGAAAYIRAQWVIYLTPKLRMSVLSTGIGGQFMHLHNNGKGVANQPLVPDFNYDKGWSENITALFFTVGTLGFESGRFSLMPELRVFALGTSSTTLTPERLIGDVKMESRPFIVTYGIKFTHRL